VSHESNQASQYQTKEDQTKGHGGGRGRGHRRFVGRVQFEFQAQLERDYRVNQLESICYFRYHRRAGRDAQPEWQDVLRSRRVDRR
jgi:hypothetical protein